MPSILFRPKPNVEKTPASPKASPLCCGSLQPTNQSTNISTSLNNNSTRSTVPGTAAISDDGVPSRILPKLENKLRPGKRFYGITCLTPPSRPQSGSDPSIGEVRLGECDDAVVMRLGASHHPLTP